MTLFLGICTPGNRIVQLNLTHNSTGRLSSPDYPLQYPSSSACYWRLQVPDGYQVKLHFTTFDIERDCKENEGAWVRVDDYFIIEFDRVSSFWGKFCSGDRPPLIYSTKTELQVFFTSNYTSNRGFKSDRQADPSTNKGFYATYEVTPQQGNERIPFLNTLHTQSCKRSSFRFPFLLTFFFAWMYESNVISN